MNFFFTVFLGYGSSSRQNVDTLIDREFPNKNAVWNSLGRVVKKINNVPVYQQSAVMTMNNGKLRLYIYHGNIQEDIHLHKEKSTNYFVSFANGEFKSIVEIPYHKFPITMVCVTFKSSKLYFRINPTLKNIIGCTNKFPRLTKVGTTSKF